MKRWKIHGALNILEHGLSRGLDALATIAILWCVPTDVFSQLAIAQAYVAPALLLFVSPETVLYRDFGKWSSEGKGRVLSRIRIFRKFAWAKAIFAFLVSAFIAAITSSPEGTAYGFKSRFLALIWAFSLPLIAQVCGPDREFLRLSLELKKLNLLTTLQRAIYLVLLLPIAKFFPYSFPAIASCGVLTGVVMAIFAKRAVENLFKGIEADKETSRQGLNLVRTSLKGFSIWNHFAGVVTGWVQTMDLFFLGIFRLPAADIGIYSVVLKFANFSLALPYAVSNLFIVYLGRDAKSDRREEIGRTLRASVYLFLFCGVQAFAFYRLSPSVISLFSKGRWSVTDQGRMVDWLRWILPACGGFAATLFWSGWMGIRTSFRRLIASVYLPWAGASAAIYAYAVDRGGANFAAQANLYVTGTFIVLLAISSLRRYE
ncbi:MAG: hypothetical protein JST04_13030 [Bdellovibrionales bacterium]|nr:hypothetical protein [Bdellovibrionales bacterium]